MGEMKKKYLIATQHFAEPSSIEPEAFFGNFNTFFMHYKVGSDSALWRAPLFRA